jgi:hypothetical protein
MRIDPDFFGGGGAASQRGDIMFIKHPGGTAFGGRVCDIYHHEGFYQQLGLAEGVWHLSKFACRLC